MSSCEMAAIMEAESEEDKYVALDIAALSTKMKKRSDDKPDISYLPCAWEESEVGGIEAPVDVRRAVLRDRKTESEVEEVMKGKQALRLLTFNFLIRPPPITYNGNDFKDERMDIMVRDHLRYYDIVCMQEIFGSLSSRRKHFIQSAGQRAGLTYSYHSPSTGIRSVVDGGCLILSRFPIVERDCVSFLPGINADWLARKGALYARIQLRPGLCIHVFTTHLQADYETNTHNPKGNLPNQQVRRDQMKTLAEFIRQKTFHHLQENPSWPVVLMGDLNINSRLGPTDGNDGPEYLEAMRIIADSGFDVHDLLKESHNGQHPVTICDSIQTPGGALVPTEPHLTPHNEFHLRRSIDYILLLTPNCDSFVEKPTKLFAPSSYGMLCSYLVDMGQTCLRLSQYRISFCLSCCDECKSDGEGKTKLKDDVDDDEPETCESTYDGDIRVDQRKKENTLTCGDDDDGSEGSISPPLPVAAEHASLVSAESTSAYYQDLHRHPRSKSKTTTTTTSESDQHQFMIKKGLLGIQPVPGIRHTVVEPFETYNPSRPYQHLSDHYAVRSLWFF